MKIKYVDGDIKIGNVNFEYVNEDEKNVYGRLGRYNHKSRTIFITKQNNPLITIYIFIHEFTHYLIRHIFNKKYTDKLNISLDSIDRKFKKYIIKYRPKAENIIKI